jgi:hypothetical protein
MWPHLQKVEWSCTFWVANIAREELAERNAYQRAFVETIQEKKHPHKSEPKI